MVRFLIPAALLLATSAQADEVTGDVLAFDRVAGVIVMEDKSVFTLPNPDVIPVDLQAGETVTIVFKTDGDNGLTSVQSITRN